MAYCRLLVCLLLLGLSSAQAQLEDAEDLDRPWINEFHYDNIGTDVNEFVEVAAPEDLDISTYQLILYNGFFGRMYEKDAIYPLTDFEVGDTVNGITFYQLPMAPQNCSSLSSWCGLESGKDGFALANFFTPTSGRVVEFLSYEGSFVAKDGPALNMTSVDIGVQQLTTTPLGWSISKVGTGCNRDDFYWTMANASTAGTVNTDQTVTCAAVFINEFHYQNENGGEGQFVEVAANVEDVSTYSVVLYNGVDGQPYDAVLLSSFETGEEEDGLTFYYYEFPRIGGNVGLEVGGMEEINGTDTTMPAGMALVNNDETVLEFLSYGGSFTAQGGVAENMTTVDVGFTEDGDTPIGSSLQLTGAGCSRENFVWRAIEANNVDINPAGDTRGEENIAQTIVCVVEVEVVTGAPEVEEENDELGARDDDFLDDNVVIFEAAGNKIGPVTYSMGSKPSRPIKQP